MGGGCSTLGEIGGEGNVGDEGGVSSDFTSKKRSGKI